MPAINLDMDVLRSFATGIDLGSFARAAERLGRSQSAISLQLRKLEEQAGQVLFRKHGRGLALTDAGETMLSYARRILELNDEAVAAVRGAAVEGWVRFGMPQDFAEDRLPAVLGRFARAHPAVRIEARVDRSAALLDRLGQGQLDLALAWDDGSGAGAGSWAEPVAALPMVWIGPEDFVYDPREPLPLIAFEPPCLFRQAGVAALDAAGIAWRLAFSSPSLAGLWAATSAGLGITLRTPAGVPDRLGILSGASGLPDLPGIGLCLHAAAADPPPAAARLRAILLDAFAAQP